MSWRHLPFLASWWSESSGAEQTGSFQALMCSCHLLSSSQQPSAPSGHPSAIQVSAWPLCWRRGVRWSRQPHARGQEA